MFHHTLMLPSDSSNTFLYSSDPFPYSREHDYNITLLDTPLISIESLDSHSTPVQEQDEWNEIVAIAVQEQEEWNEIVELNMRIQPTIPFIKPTHKPRVIEARIPVRKDIFKKPRVVPPPKKSKEIYDMDIN